MELAKPPRRGKGPHWRARGKTETQERAFTSNLNLVRATMRAQAMMRDAASFAVLKTAAN